jgi:hypothetical protein
LGLSQTVCLINFDHIGLIHNCLSPLPPITKLQGASNLMAQ